MSEQHFCVTARGSKTGQVSAPGRSRTSWLERSSASATPSCRITNIWPYHIGAEVSRVLHVVGAIWRQPAAGRRKQRPRRPRSPGTAFSSSRHHGSHASSKNGSWGANRAGPCRLLYSQFSVVRSCFMDGSVASAGAGAAGVSQPPRAYAAAPRHRSSPRATQRTHAWRRMTAAGRLYTALYIYRISTGLFISIVSIRPTKCPSRTY